MESDDDDNANEKFEAKIKRKNFMTRDKKNKYDDEEEKEEDEDEYDDEEEERDEEDDENYSEEDNREADGYRVSNKISIYSNNHPLVFEGEK